MNQRLLTDTAAQTIAEVTHSRPDSLSAIQSNIDQLMAENKEYKETSAKKIRRVGRSKKEAPKVEEVFDTKGEESAHSQIQAALIKLGKIIGCSVWIASNDRNRLFQGKPSGEGCLKSLPNLGLSEEATKRISLIDTIWILQNAPVCTFEVEITTSIYSGLPRVADLLSVVPALNIKLFIVAPKERPNRVMAELQRPTFQKIGLNDFCRFVPNEDLFSLLIKVEDLKGHVHPSILDTIAIELEEETETALE